ncbi:MAG: hypothetical protein R8L07_07740 [Alphaproteobacteria bacterium]|nr:hypothetical protein [Alphaproteobacteria bacterium]
MAVTVFDPGSVFTTLAFTPFQRSDPLVRAIQSTVVEPAGFNVLNQIGDRTFSGFTSDTAGIQSRPLQLALDNFLILASLTASFESRLQDTRAGFLRVQETLSEAIRNDNPDIRNPAETTLQNSLLAQLISAAEQAGLLEDTAAEPVAVPKFLDFTRRPSEGVVFGDTLSGVAREGALSSAFVKGVSVAAGDEVRLSDLLIGNQSATATHYTVSIRSELGGTAEAGLFDGVGTPIANGSVFTAAQLSDIRISAATGGIGSLDYLSIVELRDPEGDLTFEGRGAYRTIAVNSTAAVEERSEGVGGAEAIRDYRFYTESGTAFSQIRLHVEGVNSLGFTDALSAIEGGALRVKVGEELIDGSTNRGQIDRSQSSGNTLVVVFPFQSAEEGLAQNGLDVELRALDSGFDLSTVTARADFP